MNTSQPSTIESFWQAYLATLPTDHPHRNQSTPAAWGFGDSPHMAAELGHLVQQSIKTATCSALWEYEADGGPIPEVGELSIITNGEEHPLCLIETVQVEIKPFNQVDPQFAHDEGEGDRSLAYWRDAHWRFFTRSFQRLGRTPEETMPLVCERFRVVYT